MLDPSDLVDKNNNRCCVMTYVSLLRDAKVPNDSTEVFGAEGHLATMTDFKAFIDVRASVETAKVYHQVPKRKRKKNDDRARRAFSI